MINDPGSLMNMYLVLTQQTGIPDISSISVAPSCNQPKLMFETPKIGIYDGP